MIDENAFLAAWKGLLLGWKNKHGEAHLHQESDTHKHPSCEAFDRLVEKGLKDIEDGIWDITKGLSNIILHKLDIGKVQIFKGIRRIEEGLRDIEKALKHPCLLKDTKEFCDIIKGIKEIRKGIKEVKEALHGMSERCFTRVKAIIDGLLKIEEGLGGIHEGLSYCNKSKPVK